MRLHFRTGKFTATPNLAATRYPWLGNGFQFVDAANHFLQPTVQDSSLVLTNQAAIPALIPNQNVGPAPLIAVVDDNHAHHMSYFLLERAGQIHPDVNLMVINIDQHPDFGTSTGLMQCGNWGAHMHHTFGYPYHVFGVKASTGMQHGSNGQLQAMTGLPAFAQFINGVPAGTHIYLSIDLDVLSGPDRTTYPEGRMTHVDLLGILGMIAQAGVEVVGADITGLPMEAAFITQRYRDYIDEANAVLDSVLALNPNF